MSKPDYKKRREEGGIVVSYNAIRNYFKSVSLSHGQVIRRVEDGEKCIILHKEFLEELVEKLGKDSKEGRLIEKLLGGLEHNVI